MSLKFKGMFKLIIEKFMYVFVENTIFKKSEIVFVAESPHYNEIICNYPLAGKSGLAMSKLLFESEIPFGLIIKKRCAVPSLNKKRLKVISIINVSKRPLQRGAYTQNGLKEPDDISTLEKLRDLIGNNKSFDVTHREAVLNKKKIELFNDFKKECEDNLPPNTIIIPLGNFARNFCQKLKENTKKFADIELIIGVPHPSRNGWSKLTKEEIELIRSKILKDT